MSNEMEAIGCIATAILAIVVISVSFGFIAGLVILIARTIGGF